MSKYKIKTLTLIPLIISFIIRILVSLNVRFSLKRLFCFDAIQTLRGINKTMTNVPIDFNTVQINCTDLLKTK